MPDITINLRADDSEFEKGTDAAAKAVADWVKATETGADDVDAKFADVIRTMVNLGKQTGKSTDTIIRDLRYMGLSAEDAEDAIKAIERETADLGRKGPKDIDRVSGALKDTGGEVRDLGEIARSVLEGDFAGAAESAVNSLMGLAGAIGGGAVGGAITVALGGLVGNFVSNWANAAKEAEDRIDTMYQNMIEDGANFVTEDRVQKNLLGQSNEDIRNARERGKQLALDEQLIRRAMAGDEEAIANIVAITEERRKAELQAVRDSGKSLEDQAVQIDAINSKYGTTTDWLYTIVRETNQAKSNTEGTAAALASLSSPLDIAAGKIAGIQGQLSELMNFRDFVLNVDIDLTRARNQLNNWRPVVHIQGEVVRNGKVQLTD